MEVLILEVSLNNTKKKHTNASTAVESCGSVPPQKSARRHTQGGWCLSGCSEAWMESNCEGPRLGIFGGAAFAEAPPPDAADWSLDRGSQ